MEIIKTSKTTKAIKAPVEKINKTQQELQDFLEYIVQTCTIHVSQTNELITESSILTQTFNEPGRKKLEFLCKHVLTHFDVFQETTKLNDYNELIVQFKNFNALQKKPRKPRIKKEVNEVHNEKNEAHSEVNEMNKVNNEIDTVNEIHDEVLIHDEKLNAVNKVPINDYLISFDHDFCIELTEEDLKEFL